MDTLAKRRKCLWHNETMTKKRILIIFLAIILISIILAFLQQRGQVKLPFVTRTTQPSTQIPEGATLKFPEGNTIKISNKEVENFYKTAYPINNNGDVVFSETENYKIIYFPKGEQFLISILGTPFEEAKKEAEQQFLQSLGISESEACELNVSVSTPRFANEAESGKNYKLSFCE